MSETTFQGKTRAEFCAALAKISKPRLAELMKEQGVQPLPEGKGEELLSACFDALVARVAASEKITDEPAAPSGAEPSQDSSPDAAGSPSVPPAEVSPVASERRFNVRAMQERGRWRGGRFFPMAGETIAESALSLDEWTAVRADPVLRVIEVK